MDENSAGSVLSSVSGVPTVPTETVSGTLAATATVTATAAGMKADGMAGLFGGGAAGSSDTEKEKEKEREKDRFHDKITCICSKDMSIITNIVNAILGVSVFLVPWGFQMSGTVGGALVVCLVACCSYQTSLAMVTVQQTLLAKRKEVYDYPEVVSACLGPLGGQIVGLATVVSCAGASISYLIFLGHLLDSLLHVDFVVVLIAVSPILVLLSWIRSFQDLSVFAGLGSGFVMLTIVLITFDNRTDSTLAQLVMSGPTFKSGVTGFFGPATFLFTVHYCVMAISSEALRERSAHRTRVRSVHHLDSSFSVDARTPRLPHLESSSGELDSSDGKDPATHHAFNMSRPLFWAYVISCAIVIFHGTTAMSVYRHHRSDFAGWTISCYNK
jgi:hypothetical protein